MKKKIEVSGYVLNQTEKYRCVKIDKIEKVCGECDRVIGAKKPYGQIFIPLSLGDLDQIIVSVKTKEESK